MPTVKISIDHGGRHRRLDERARTRATTPSRWRSTAGASDAEATCRVVRPLQRRSARDREIEKLERSTSNFFAVRVFVNGRKATLSTSDFSTTVSRALCRRAVALAELRRARRTLRDFPMRRNAASPKRPRTFRGGRRAARRRREGGRRAALERTDARVRSARRQLAAARTHGDSKAITALANSRGFRGSYRSTRVRRSTEPDRADGERKRIATYGTAARGFGDLEDADAIARLCRAPRDRSLRRAQARNHARVRSSSNATSPQRGARRSLRLDQPRNVAIGNSWLIGQIGERIGSEAVTIRRRRALARGPRHLALRRRRRGDAATRWSSSAASCARFFTTRTTAQAGRRAAPATPTGGGIGPNNFYLEPGAVTLDDLIAATPRGVLVLDTIGFATEHVSGTYSRGARGFFHRKRRTRVSDRRVYDRGTASARCWRQSTRSRATCASIRPSSRRRFASPR